MDKDRTEICRFCSDPKLISGFCSDRLWPDGDVAQENVEVYKAALLKANSSKKRPLACELHLVSFSNFTRRLEAVLELIKEERTELHRMVDKNGATALHTALKRNRTEAALLLIDYGGKRLVFSTILDKQYTGTTALHMAVVNSNRVVVKAMIDILAPNEIKALIHSQANGSYFCDNDHVSSLPLSLGVWCPESEILYDLIGYGANLDSREIALGDTVLHTIVRSGVRDAAAAIATLHSLLDCQESKAWWCAQRAIHPDNSFELERSKFRRYLFKIKNDEGYTPLTLAAKLGLSDIVVDILNLEGVYKFTDWEFGEFSHARFEMNEIDGILASRVENSVLDILLVSNDQALSAFASPVLRRLSEVKWEYTWLLFTFWFIYHLGVMMVFTTVAVFSPLQYHNETGFYSDGNATALTIIKSPGDHARVAGELLVLLTAMVYGITEVSFMVRSLLSTLYSLGLMKSAKRKGKGWIVVIKPDAFRLVLRAFCVSVIVWAVQRVRGRVQEDIAMAIGLITGWYYVLFFTQAVEETSFFTLMIHRMLFGDLLRFIFSVSALLIGFGSANLVLYMASTSGRPEQFASFDIALLTMFRLFAGLTDQHSLGSARNQDAATILYIFFVLIATILLINMLISAMSDTYASVSQKRDLFFLKCRLECVIYLENNIPCVYRTYWMLSRYMTFDSHTQRWELTVYNA